MSRVLFPGRHVETNILTPSLTHLGACVHDVQATTARIGLVVGRRREDATCILQILETPTPSDGTTPIATISSVSTRSPTSFRLDVPDSAARSVCAHARSVARILPGGIHIIGVFAFCDAQAFDVKALATLLKQINAATVDPVDGDVIVHIVARRGTIPVLPSPSQDPQTSYNVQNTDLLHELVEVRTTYRCCFLPDSMSRERESKGKTVVADVLQGMITREVKQRVNELRVAEKGQSLHNLMTSYVKRAGLDHVPLHLFSVDATPTPLAQDIHSLLNVQPMNISCRAFVFLTETVDDAHAELRRDIEVSLKARLEAMIDRASAPPSASSSTHPLLREVSSLDVPYRPCWPRRCFFDWRRGGGAFCHHVFRGDASKHEALEHIRHLVGSGVVDGRSWTCEERLPVEEACDIDDKEDTEDHGEGRREGRRGGSSIREFLARCFLMVVGAVVCAVLAILAM